MKTAGICSALRYLVFVSCLLPTAGRAATFVVNSAADTDDTACQVAPGNCTLREAINAANASNVFDTINFAIPPA